MAYDKGRSASLGLAGKKARVRTTWASISLSGSMGPQRVGGGTAVEEELKAAGWAIKDWHL